MGYYTDHSTDFTGLLSRPVVLKLPFGFVTALYSLKYLKPLTAFVYVNNICSYLLY